MNLCECGCEQPTNLDRQGRPQRFLQGHGRHTFRLKNFVVDAAGCWLWQGTIHTSGYGVLYVERKKFYAHRWFYEHFVGLIPEGLQLDHLCRVRNCVNPEHLEPVTARENYVRCPRVTSPTCKHGHPRQPPHLAFHNDGYRYCLTCEKERRPRANALRRARRAAAKQIEVAA